MKIERRQQWKTTVERVRASWSVSSKTEPKRFCNFHSLINILSIFHIMKEISIPRFPFCSSYSFLVYLCFNFLLDLVSCRGISPSRLLFRFQLCILLVLVAKLIARNSYNDITSTTIRFKLLIVLINLYALGISIELTKHKNIYDLQITMPPSTA